MGQSPFLDRLCDPELSSLCGSVTVERKKRLSVRRRKAVLHIVVNQLLLGSKKVRKMTGGLVGYGGAAAIGALAHKAYQNWQQGNQVATAPVAGAADLNHVDPHLIPGTSAAGSNFTLALISAMIGAAKADGHIDAREQTAIFEHVHKLGLDAESKAFVFDALNKPADIATITAGVQGVEQASEMYLVSRLIADGDNPGERMYMEALAHRLKLPAELVAHLEHQVKE